MSETSGHMEQYDSDDVFLQDETCVEQNPRPLHLDAVFEEVRLWQAQHQEHVFTSHREASLYMKRVVNNFDMNVQTKNMLGRAVVIGGAGIEVAHASYNEITGKFIMEPMNADQLDNHVSVGAAVHGLKGDFAGFGYRLVHMNARKSEADADAEAANSDDMFTGRLLYQVATGGVSHAHGYTQFFVTGNVLDSRIEFYDDIQKQKLDSILVRLLTIESFAAAELINDLNILLSEQDKLAQHLPEIVRLVGQITESKDFKNNLVKRDVLLDLVTHYIDAQGQYSFTAPDAVHIIKGKRRARIYPEDNPMSVSEYKMSGIVLGNAYRREDNKIISSRSRYIPYFVLQKSDQVIHVAMDRLSKFAVVE